jgi:hypothetical protein
MDVNAYADAYIEGLYLAAHLHPLAPRRSLEAVQQARRRIDVHRQGTHDAESARALARHLLPEVLRFVRRLHPLHDLADHAHQVCALLLRALPGGDPARAARPGEPGGLTLTVGAVRWRDTELFPATADDVIRTLRPGARRRHAAPPARLHVWLTAADLTIIDPTVQATLLQRGAIAAPDYHVTPVIHGKPHRIAGFTYHPLYADNDFLDLAQADPQARRA